ncbi:unnamed protein product, partial [Callosobruchus maculatus]
LIIIVLWLNVEKNNSFSFSYVGECGILDFVFVYTRLFLMTENFYNLYGFISLRSTRVT